MRGLAAISRRCTVLIAAAVLAAACGSAPEAAPADSARSRVLGGVPASEAERGVYVVDLEEAGELSPGSRVRPFLGPVLDAARLLVETNAPPLTLLGGVPPDVETPAHAIRVDDVLVFAEPAIAEAAAALLRDNAAPAAHLQDAAASPAPVVWVGPTPAPNAQGRTLIEYDAEQVRIRVTPTMPLDDAAAFAQEQLADGAPPGSPGKPWTAVVADPAVAVEGEAVVITAKPRDLPGALIRSLIDQRQLSFLPP